MSHIACKESLLNVCILCVCVYWVCVLCVCVCVCVCVCRVESRVCAPGRSAKCVVCEMKVKKMLTCVVIFYICIIHYVLHIYIL